VAALAPSAPLILPPMNMSTMKAKEMREKLQSIYSYMILSTKKQK